MAKKKIDKRTKEYKEYIKDHPQGVGDIIESITEATGIKKLVTSLFGENCGCDERRDGLNAMLPFRFQTKRCLTESEYNWYDNYYKNRTLNLVTELQLKEVVKLHESIFLWKVNNLCHNCSGSAVIIRDMIKRLDKVYQSYETK
jgi:hypothetical protein